MFGVWCVVMVMVWCWYAWLVVMLLVVWCGVVLAVWFDVAAARRASRPGARH